MSTSDMSGSGEDRLWFGGSSSLSRNPMAGFKRLKLMKEMFDSVRI